jgi:hypothetical protein
MKALKKHIEFSKLSQEGDFNKGYIAGLEDALILWDEDAALQKEKRHRAFILYPWPDRHPQNDVFRHLLQTDARANLAWSNWRQLQISDEQLIEKLKKLIP